MCRYPHSFWMHTILFSASYPDSCPSVREHIISINTISRPLFERLNFIVQKDICHNHLEHMYAEMSSRAKSELENGVVYFARSRIISTHHE